MTFDRAARLSEKRQMHRERWAHGLLFGCLSILVCSCNQRGQPPMHRVELRKVGGESIELVPVAGTPPYCLVFSVAESGVVRQLTMNADDASANCEPGKPIGGHPFQIPAREGKVRIYTIFSDQKLAASPIADQVRELGSKPNLTALDLRAPGRVVTDTLEFVPEPEQR
jgi:hypothetical protein